MNRMPLKCPDRWRNPDIVEFWRDQTWPLDLSGYVFLGRAILDLGDARFGKGWHRSGNTRSFAEARAEIAKALLARLQAGIDHAGYLEGSTVKDIDAGRWAGISVDAPAFGRCRANPEDLDGRYAWAPVSRSSWAPVGHSSAVDYFDGPLHRWIFLRVRVDDVSEQDAKPSNSASAQRHAGGAPQRYYRAPLRAEFERLMEDNGELFDGDQNWRTQADIQRALFAYISANPRIYGLKEPSLRTMKNYVRDWLAEWRRSKGNN